MTYIPTRIHLWPNNNGQAQDYQNYYGSYFHNIGVYDAKLDLSYSTNGSRNPTLAENQKIGPVLSSLLLTDIWYVLTALPYIYSPTLGKIQVSINTQPQIVAGTSPGATNVHGTYNLNFRDRRTTTDNYNVVGVSAKQDITDFKRGVIVPKGGYVWITNNSSNDVCSLGFYYVTALIKGFSYRDEE